jgi:hypothetical protein
VILSDSFLDKKVFDGLTEGELLVMHERLKRLERVQAAKAATSCT